MEIASMLIPAFVEATFTDEQTICVSARAWGIAEIRFLSAGVIPLWTSAEKPPIKLIPRVSAALCSVFATFT